MTCERTGIPGLEYEPCRYAGVRTLFRGPKPDLSDPYVVYFGGSETYGKFVPSPYPALIAAQAGLGAVNLGVMNSGPDLYLTEPDLLALADGAVASVIQMTGAPNLTNRYYSVHPRRNDRFLRPSPLLQTIYRDVDFTQFSFTRHMLRALQTLSPERFAILRVELQQAWVGRMRALIAGLRSPVVLLWMGEHAIPDQVDPVIPPTSHGDPLFIDRAMIDALRPEVSAIVEVPASPRAQARRLDGMIYSQLEAAAAQSQPGVAHHEEVAAALLRVLQPDVTGRVMPVT